MLVQDDMWEGIPLLHVYDEKMDDQSPVVIFLHGFQSAKEHNLHYAYQFVKNGVRVIMPDAIYHGARSEHLSEMEMNMNFWRIVLNTIQEVNIIYEELMTKGYAGQNKIGIAGTSMGGIVASGCLKQYEWIDAAAICMGAPGYVGLANWQISQFEASGVKLPLTEEERVAIQQNLSNFDITMDIKRFNYRPVMFWHGHKDRTVPFEPTYHFYNELRSYYAEAPDYLQFIDSPDSGHQVPRSGVLAVTSFLSQHLA